MVNRSSRRRPLGAAPIDRRHFLLGAGATLALAACGGSSGDGDADDALGGEDAVVDIGESSGGLAAARFFSPDTVVSDLTPQRMPWGVADQFGPLTTGDAPPRVAVSISRDGELIAPRTDVFRRDTGLVFPYYPVVASFEEPGLYDIEMRWGRDVVVGLFQVLEPTESTILRAGGPMPAVTTPTVDDPAGVQPICTRSPEICPLHDRTLDEVLAEGRPTAVLVSTPAYCQTQVCGPILELLVAEQEARPDLAAVHLEVYAEPETTLETLTPAMSELGLTFEPSLFLVRPDGVVAERLDHVVDRTEMAEALDRLTA